MEQRDCAEVTQLSQQMRRLGSLVSGMVDRAVAAVVQRDSGLAEDTIASDETVDALEREVREDCMRHLAMSPSATTELHFITTAMKVGTNLEQTGDQAASISQLAVALNEEPQLKPFTDIPRMGHRCQQMLLDSVDAFVRGDVGLARGVIAANKEIDALKEQVFRVLLTFMMENAENLPRALLLLQVSDHLRRIAEYASDISSLAVLLAEGRDSGPRVQPEP